MTNEQSTLLREVDAYLHSSTNAFELGTDEYFMRIALMEAVAALSEGNYAVGAVAVVCKGDTLFEFRAGNAMFTGLGVVDHAETRALLAIKSQHQASTSYPRSSNEYTSQVPDGISVYGTLEPCPMCACTLTNVGVRRSVSAVLDGELVVNGGFTFSDGAANVIGKKREVQPAVWKWIQDQQGLQFDLMSSEDPVLPTLCKRIFLETREEIDTRLASRATT